MLLCELPEPEGRVGWGLEAGRWMAEDMLWLGGMRDCATVFVRRIIARGRDTLYGLYPGGTVEAVRWARERRCTSDST